jgi:hypothetical protein
MIPAFYDGEFLPDGDHDATWQEVQARFGRGACREHLCERMSQFIMTARRCGFRQVFLFGSFISGKEEPGDLDMLWVYRAESLLTMEPECKDLINYGMMKIRYDVDSWCCSDDKESVMDLLTGWRKNKTRTKIRGIIRIDLERFEGLIL